MVSNITFDILGNSQMLTEFWTLDLLLIAEIRFKLQEIPESILKILCLELWESAFRFVLNLLVSVRTKLV